jgi:hypothetical protein
MSDSTPIKLVFFQGCPNAERARVELGKAGLNFMLVEQGELEAGHPLLSYTSPSLLIGDSLIFGSRTSNGGSAGCTLQIPRAEELEELVRKHAARLRGMDSKRRTTG